MLDRAVLPGCIHRLEHEQQRPAILGVKQVLLLCEPLGALLEELGRLALSELQPAGVAGIKVLQLKALAFCDAERLSVLLDAIEDLFSRHRVTSPQDCIVPMTGVFSALPPRNMITFILLMGPRFCRLSGPCRGSVVMNLSQVPGLQLGTFWQNG